MITKSEKETINLAKKYARQLKGGQIIALEGELGAGKTVFVRGLAQGLGIKNKITSPTFVLMKVYKVNKRNIKHFVHIDAYRLSNDYDLENIGAYEYFSRDSVVVIEWAQKIPSLKKNITHYVKIKYLNLNKREIIIENNILIANKDKNLCCKNK